MTRVPGKRRGTLAQREQTPDTGIGGGHNERKYQGLVNPDPHDDAALPTRSGGPRNRTLDRASFLSASRRRAG